MELALRSGFIDFKRSIAIGLAFSLSFGSISIKGIGELIRADDIFVEASTKLYGLIYGSKYKILSSRALEAQKPC